MNLKRNYNIVFKPKDRRFKKRRYIMISINRLPLWIGDENTALILTIGLQEALKTGRYKKKLPNLGTIYVYNK
jgi:hypothetical protein